MNFENELEPDAELDALAMNRVNAKGLRRVSKADFDFACALQKRIKTLAIKYQTDIEAALDSSIEDYMACIFAITNSTFDAQVALEERSYDPALATTSKRRIDSTLMSLRQMVMARASRNSAINTRPPKPKEYGLAPIGETAQGVDFPGFLEPIAIKFSGAVGEQAEHELMSGFRRAQAESVRAQAEALWNPKNKNPTAATDIGKFI